MAEIAEKPPARIISALSALSAGQKRKLSSARNKNKYSVGDTLSTLIHSALTNQPISGNYTEEEWQRCFDMALAQNVLAMTFPAMTALPKEQRPSFVLWSKWMAYAQSVAEQSQYKCEVVKKIGAWLAEDELSTTLIKGFSISVLYPRLELREFSDIDIFSGKDYDAVNACFAKHGVKVDSVDGHHAYLKVDGISVEHHFAFSNTKVKDGLLGPEETLKQLAVKNQQPTSIPGIYFPTPAFTALFVGWHAYEHFLQEKIQLRHVIDWVLALRALTPSDAVVVRQTIENATWSRFADTLTAIAIHQLGLPQEWFPANEIEIANSIDEVQEQMVWDDIINTLHTPHSHNSNSRRISIGKRILKNSWKYKAFANISAQEALWKDVVGHFKSKIKRPQI